MAKRLKSTDPRKPAVKAALLKAAGVERGKVTMIREGRFPYLGFEGRVLVKEGGSWKLKGVFTVQVTDVWPATPPPSA